MNSVADEAQCRRRPCLCSYCLPGSEVFAERVTRAGEPKPSTVQYQPRKAVWRLATRGQCHTADRQPSEQLGKAEGLRLVFWAVFSGQGGNEREIPCRSDGNEDLRGHEPWRAKPTTSATKPSPARQHGRVAEETSARFVFSVY